MVTQRLGSSFASNSIQDSSILRGSNLDRSILDKPIFGRFISITFSRLKSIVPQQ